MRVVQIDSFSGGREEFSRRGHLDFLQKALTTDKISMKPGCTTRIRAHVDTSLKIDGWSVPYRINGKNDLKITARKDEMVFQIQTGNISRYSYDLLKLQYVFEEGFANCACLAVPSLNASKRISGNLANGERIASEMEIFRKFIKIPLLLLTFDD